MPAQQVLVMAMTHMLSGVCTAGFTKQKDPASHLCWIRPVKEYGTILLGDLTDGDGRVIQPGDVIELHARQARPDLPRFAIEILRSRAGQSNKVLSAEMAQHMLAPQLEDYDGLGLALKRLDGSTRFSHPGCNEGFRCFMLAYIGSGQGAVVMTNADDGQDLALEVLRGIARVYDWPDLKPQERTLAQVDPGVYDACAGEYQYVDYPDHSILVARQGDRLSMQALPDGRCIELWPASETSYFVIESGAEITFVRGPDGDMHEMETSEGEKLKKRS